MDTQKKMLGSDVILQKKKLMIETLKSTAGIVTPASEKCGVARSSHYKWMNEDEEYKRQVLDISDLALDLAESSLVQQIQDKNTTATIFYLKTKGKKRGYVEGHVVNPNRMERPNIVFKPREKKD